MSVVAIAVIDRLGNPMYLRDFVAPLLFDLYVQSSAPDQPDNDFFCDSLVEETSKQHSEWPCRINYQFTIFAAHDKATQMLNGGWRGVGAVGPDACWMGLICCVNGLNAYGYATSNARYIILVEDAIAPDDVQLLKSRENELKILMSQVHGLFTDHLLNPFSQPNSKITSKRFGSGVQALVNTFNTRL